MCKNTVKFVAIPIVAVLINILGNFRYGLHIQNYVGNEVALARYAMTAVFTRNEAFCFCFEHSIAYALPANGPLSISETTQSICQNTVQYQINDSQLCSVLFIYFFHMKIKLNPPNDVHPLTIYWHFYYKPSLAANAKKILMFNNYSFHSMISLTRYYVFIENENQCVATIASVSVSLDFLPISAIIIP